MSSFDVRGEISCLRVPLTAALIIFSSAEDETSRPAAASGNGSQSVHVRICEFVGGRQVKSMRCNNKRCFPF